MGPGRDLGGLLRLPARDRDQLAPHRSAGRPSRHAGAGGGGRGPPRGRAGGQRDRVLALAGRRPLRPRDDARLELPRAGGVGAAAVPLVRAAARARDLDRAIGQRPRAGRFCAGGAVPDLRHRLAPLVPRARRADGRRGSSDRPRLPHPGASPGRGRADRAIGCRRPQRAGVDGDRRDAHAALLAALRGVPAHRARELPGVAAPAGLGHRGRVRPALRGQRARHRQPARGGRHDRHRDDLRLHRA